MCGVPTRYLSIASPNRSQDKFWKQMEQLQKQKLEVGKCVLNTDISSELLPIAISRTLGARLGFIQEATCIACGVPIRDVPPIVFIRSFPGENSKQLNKFDKRKKR